MTPGAQLPPRSAASGCASTTWTACGWTRTAPCSTSTTRARKASGCPTNRGARGPGGGQLPQGAQRGRPRPRSGVVSAAEESTAWPGVSRPTYLAAWLRVQSGHGGGTTTRWTTSGATRSTGASTTTSSRSRSCTPSARTSSSRCPTTRSCTARGRCTPRWPAMPLAEARQPALALRLHVGAPRQEPAVHGLELAQEQEWSHERSSWTGTCSSSPRTPGSSRWSADLTASTEPSRRSGSRTSTRRVSVAGGQRRQRQHLRVRPRLQAERVIVCAANRHRLSPGRCRARGAGARRSTPTPHYYGGSGARGQPRRDRDRATALERPALFQATLPPLGAAWLVPEDSSERRAGSRRPARSPPPRGVASPARSPPPRRGPRREVLVEAAAILRGFQLTRSETPQVEKRRQVATAPQSRRRRRRSGRPADRAAGRSPERSRPSR